MITTPLGRLALCLTHEFPGNDWKYEQTPWESVTFSGTRLEWIFTDQIELTDETIERIEKAVSPVLVVEVKQIGKRTIEILLLDGECDE